MSANVDAMVREGINAYRAGNKEEARALLLKAVELDELNEQAWLWLSAVVDTVEDQQTCLENVLSINPNNERAKQGLRILSQKAAGSSAVTSSQKSDDDAFASVSFTSPSPPAKTPPKVEEDELPTAVEWDIPATETSSASSLRPVNEPSSQDYDNWVAGLNLNPGSAPLAVEPSPPPSSSASPFLLDEVDENMFGFDDEPALPESTATNFASGPFASFADTANDFEFEPEQPFSAPRVAAAPHAGLMSPPVQPPTREDDNLLGDIEADDEFLENYDQAEIGELDPHQFFTHIPAEIKATRLPGTKEREPILLLLALIVLVLLNGGAVALLWATLTQ